MPRLLTIENINSRIKDRDITLIGEYINGRTQTEFQCHKKHIWKVAPNDVIHGNGCPYCSHKFPLTKEIINKRLNDRGIVISGEYVNNYTKTKFQCANGHEWETTANSVLSGCGCSQCTLDYSKPATIYILEIIGNDDKFTGFGITNNIHLRFSEHSAYLRKSNKYISKQHVFNLASRFTALSIENRLKTSLPIYNSNITGFKTEATKLSFDKVISIVENFTIQEEQND